MTAKHFILLLAAFFIIASGIFAADTPKSLTIMLDGARADVLLMGKMPTFDALRNGTWAEGYQGAWSLSAHTIKDAGTASAANHTAIATGVTTAKTNVPNNGKFDDYNITGASAKYPTFLTRIKQKYPEKKVAFTASWKPDHFLVAKNNVCDIFWNKNDKENVQQIVSLIDGTFEAEKWSKGTDPDAILWFIDEPDHVGHSGGYSPPGTQHDRYVQCLEEMDAWIKKALDAIKKRPNFANESWQIIITSDHGGWVKGHGAMSGECYTIPFIVSSKTVKQGELRGQPCDADAAPTVLAHYGFDVAALKKEGLIDGSVRGQDVVAVSDKALDAKTVKELPPIPAEESFSLAFKVKVSAPQTGNLFAYGESFKLFVRSEGKGNIIGLNIADDAGTKIELKQLFITTDTEWFVAATVDRTGNARIYVGNPEGRLFFCSQSLLDENLGKSFGKLTGKLSGAWTRGGTGIETNTLRFWGRALSIEEVKKVFEAK
jgi:hypothetical protein